jgi:hypothetical protein
MRPGVDDGRVHLPSWLFDSVPGLVGCVIGGVTDTGAGVAGVAECQDPDISGLVDGLVDGWGSASFGLGGASTEREKQRFVLDICSNIFWGNVERLGS